MNRRRHQDRLWTRLAVPVLAVLAVLAVWLLLVHGAGVAPYVLPSPSATVHAIADDWDVLSQGIVITGEEFVLGFLLGTVTGFVLAVFMAQSRWVLRALYPLLIASQAVPIIAIGAALVIWLGFGLTPKVVIVGLIVFFPVVVNVLDGLASVDEDSISLARSMGGGPWRTFRTVRLPATYTPLFSALKMSATFSVTGAVIGEQTASSTGGLGVYLTQQQSRLNTAGVFGDIVLLAAMGIIAFALIAVLETVVTPWRRHSSVPRRWRASAVPVLPALDTVQPASTSEGAR
ncbi:ABC transporter permease [Streptomyces sp. NBC_00988]|uniref:ABC transporter permease n=1 Tax=Streptomyces sp. NBC_00988 TaxID=2903704 RepID=UPI00386C52E5|nr:ABC transporter permease [Streptomyces sp. NBC_00988]